VRIGRGGEEEGGNRGVSPLDLFDIRADLSGAEVEANIPEEGGTRGKHGFTRATEPKAREAVCMVAAGRKAA
jgi:hypothetical protein